MKAKLYIWAVALGILLTMLSACATTPPLPPLSPQYCKPATDLTKPKYLKRVPERATSNDEFYNLFLSERVDHATDIRDYNSLLRTCVEPKLPKRFPVFFK